MNVSLEPFLHLAAALLALGIYGLLTRRETHSAIASLQIITHAIVIALVALQRGSHPGTGPGAGFADAFGALVVMILGVQAIVGLSLILHQQSADHVTDPSTATPNDPAIDR